MPNDSRIKILNAAPEAVQEQYSSLELGEKLINLRSTLNLTERTKQKALALAIGDIILGIHKKDSLDLLLRDKVGLSAPQIRVVFDELKVFLDKIQTQSSSSPTPITIQSTTAPEGLRPIHTFADDVALSHAHGYGTFQQSVKDGGVPSNGEEPVHRSSQDDIIKK